MTPGRRLLFARGEFEHEYIVKRFLATSVYGVNVYANWSCVNWRGKHDTEHDTYLGIYGDARVQKCKCGRPRIKHNEIDLVLKKLMLTGHPDMVVLHNGIYYICEFKSIDRADVSFDDITQPLAAHRLQISFYYKIMRAMGFRVSRRLTVVYVDRSNSKIWGGLPYKELQCTPVPDKDMDKFKNKLLHVRHGVANRTLPERICPKIKMERAKACNYAVECFERKRSAI